jgi:YlmC/YmxH family sporulation protein
MGELAGKEIVNIYNGSRLGVVGESDLVLDIESGEIRSIILPKKNNLFNMWIDRQNLVIPWEAIRKVGDEVIIVDLDQTSPGYQRFSSNF